MEIIQNEKTDKGANPLHEGLEIRHILKPEPQKSKKGGPPPPIKKK